MSRDPQLAEAAEKAAADFPNFDAAPRLNHYRCEVDPRHQIVTIDREPGVTPFQVPCPFCKAQGPRPVASGHGLSKYPSMVSACYRVAPTAIPTYEWYRPDSLDGVNAQVTGHLLMGGLLMRKIGEG